MKEIQLYDIKNNPEKVNKILVDKLLKLDNEFFILAVGNHFNFDDDTQWALRRFIKDIQYYVLKEEAE